MYYAIGVSAPSLHRGSTDSNKSEEQLFTCSA